MNDFCLEQTSLRFEGLGGIPLLKLPWSPPTQAIFLEIKINVMCSLVRWRLGLRWLCGAWEESDCL